MRVLERDFYRLRRGLATFTASRPRNAPLRPSVVRALTARQLACRKWSAVGLAALLVAIPGTMAGLAFASADLTRPLAFALACLPTAALGCCAFWFWPFGLRPSWQPLGDAEMVQLLELARCCSGVGSLVHLVNEQGRDFVRQDWLQACAIEVEVGEQQQALKAIDAQRRLRAGPAAWVQP